MASHINNKKFIPYIRLHEFESFLPAEIDAAINNLMDCRKPVLEKTINDALQQADNNPELINNFPETTPGKRILKGIFQLSKDYRRGKCLS